MTGTNDSAEGDAPDAPDAPLLAQIALYLMSQDNGAELTVQYGIDGVPAVKELLMLFGDADDLGVSIDPAQKASPSLKANLTALVGQHGRRLPHLNRLKKFICDLPDDSHFLVLPACPRSTSDRVECERLLNRLNNPGDSEEEDRAATALFKDLLDKYDMDYPRTDRATVIGSRGKSQRTCRFCSRSMTSGATFKNVAHAIATALGNDHLKLADECDECNAFFGREIEPSLIAMLDIPRAFLGTQGRGKNGGRPELRFENGKLQHDGTKVVLASSGVEYDGATGRMTVDLGRGAHVVPSAVYRALVKVALSAVDAGALPHLLETIAWVRHGKHADRALPRVSTQIVNLPPSPSAEIVVYRRKSEESRLPHLVGEFRLGCFMYVFVVPFSSRDSWDLVDYFTDPAFRETFKHHASVEGWVHYDLSSSNRVTLKSKLQFLPDGEQHL